MFYCVLQVPFCRYCDFSQLEAETLHQQKDYKPPKAQMTVNIFSNEVFLIKVRTFLTQHDRTLNRLQRSVNITSAHTGEREIG